MQQYVLDPQALLGGIIAQDINQELVQLALQKGNQTEWYAHDAIILLIVLNGRISVSTEEQQIESQGLQVIRLEPNEAHAITALEDNTTILAVKQLLHSANLSKHLRFGTCCL